MILAIVRFGIWEAAIFAAAIALAWALGWRGAEAREEKWLAILAIQVTLESGVASLLSFLRINSAANYWIFSVLCAAGVLAFGRNAFFAPSKKPEWSGRWTIAVTAALLVPLAFIAFKPVEEIDSINYLHYLIEWMGNRATPYTFATGYVAFWEASFLPAWTITGADFFFPLLALKSVIMLWLAAWLVGRELGVRRNLLWWAVAGSAVLRHLWYEHSGVPTLKNDALHGVGFLLLLLVLIRASRRGAPRTDLASLGFGMSFACVKYTGIFLAFLTVICWVALQRRLRSLLWPVALFLLTSGHYYLRTLVEHGSPFYPFQINLGPIHLPGTADLSATSILYSLRSPRLWQVLFLPEGGISPAGILFPAILAAALSGSAFLCAHSAWNWIRHRTRPTPVHWAAFLILCGWFLYFRSVFSASASITGGDLAFLVNGLNSIRYVDGVLVASEILLVSLMARLPVLALALIGVNLGSRLIILYTKLPLDLFPITLVIAIAIAVFMCSAARRPILLIPALLIACPILVQRNRAHWTTYWNDLKPTLERVRGAQLAEFATPDGGYFAGHVVAAGNPVDSRVRSLLPEELEALPRAQRPRFLAMMVTPGSEIAGDWRSKYGPQAAAWGYDITAEGKFGALLERNVR